MVKTIFNVYVVMESQEQCDRMKQLCLDNGLPIWKDFNGWLFLEDIIRGLSIDNEVNEFYCYNVKLKYGKTKVTEEQFIQLLKDYKDGSK